MANANPANSMEVVSVKCYKVTQMPKGGEMRTHYNWTLRQADRFGALSLDEDGKVTAIHEENLKFDLPKGMIVEDVLSAGFMKEVPEEAPPKEKASSSFLQKLAGK